MHTPLEELKRLLRENDFSDGADFCARVHPLLMKLGNDLQHLTLDEKSAVCDSQASMSSELVDFLRKTDRTFRWMLNTESHLLFPAFIQALLTRQYEDAREMSELFSDEENQALREFLEKDARAERFTKDFLKKMSKKSKALVKFITKNNTFFSRFVIDVLGDPTQDCEIAQMEVFLETMESVQKLWAFVQHDVRIMDIWSHRISVGHLHLIELLLTVGKMDPNIIIPKMNMSGIHLACLSFNEEEMASRSYIVESMFIKKGRIDEMFLLGEARQSEKVSLLIKGCLHTLHAMQERILQLKQFTEEGTRKMIARYQKVTPQFLQRVKALVGALTEEERADISVEDLQILREAEEATTSLAQQLCRSLQQDGLMRREEKSSEANEWNQPLLQKCI